MDDDFTLNFATGPAPSSKTAAAPRKEKGGRWTDRVKDKRRQEAAVKRQNRPPGATMAQASTMNGHDARAQTSGGGLGKRSRGDQDDEQGAEASSRAVRNKSSSGQSGRAGLGNSSAPGGKAVQGVSGKKQYISSLFTAEGLPTPSAQPNGPIVPSQPSNAPLRAPEAADSDGAVEADAAQSNSTKSTASAPAPAKPSPAPALSALGIMPELVNHLAGKMNITGPTACQAGAIPPLLAANSTTASSGDGAARDAILQAQTGSGKTLAFLLPMLQDLLTLNPAIFGSFEVSRSVGTLALILAPTRELAAQIYAVLESLLSIHGSQSFTVPPRALTACLLVGGANRTHEKSRLRKGCPIVVATPGRLLDHLRTTESFRFAGEPLKKAGPRGRVSLPGSGPSHTGTGANSGALGVRGDGRPLGLRWLIVDECDRLMDLGFEEQMRGVLEEVERRSPSALITGKGRRRTVLCSATVSEGVDRLAGMALRDPVTLRAKEGAGISVVPNAGEHDTEQRATKNGTVDEDDELGQERPMVKVSDEPKIKFTPPTQLVHNYIVVPPKLRFVGLVALLRRLLVSPQAKKGPGNKILIFLSCTAAVDFYWEALGSMGMGSAEAASASSAGSTTNSIESGKDKAAREAREAQEAEDKAKRLASLSVVLPGVPIYRLHGNLELQTRLGSLAAFSRKSEAKAGKNKGSDTENAVLLCTSVAARGLDVPFVSHVVQYDLPTEGGVTEYIHRVGRTARAGAQGQATSFLLPSEKEWVPWVEQGMRDGVEKREAKDVKLREVGVEDVLKDGFGGEGREYETRATDVQMGFERWVNAEEESSTLARNAFASHIRAYATHPSSEKSMFNLKAVHLGHLAKSFGMREAPGAHSAPKGKKRTKGKKQNGAGGKDDQGARELARAVAAMPSSRRSGGFETGRKHDEQRAAKRNQDKMMRGPTGEGSGDYQVAGSDLLEMLAKGKMGGSGKKRRS